MKTIHFIACFLVSVLLSGNVHTQELTPNPHLEEVIVVFKTHFDIGYTDYAESVLRKYGSSMIEGALDNLEASKELPPEERFVWTLPAWPMQQILDRSNPENKTRVEKALRNGNFAVHALPFTVETEASGLENLARSFQFSSRISEEYGLDLPRDAKMTDVPSHSWVLPTILNNAGISFLHLGCNLASQSPDVPLLFWWEGPDGSRLMTMYYPKYYGTELVSPEGWPYKTWMALVPTNDNQGAPPVKKVRKTLQKIKELAPNATIKIGRMSDFYDSLIKEELDLPVVKGDMPDTWIHGYMSMPEEMKTSLRMHKNIYALEALNTQLNIWTQSSVNISKMIDRATENSLLFDEHTFGLAISHGQSGRWAYGNEFRRLKSQGIYEPIEKSWKEKGDRVYEAEKKVMPNYKDELERLASEIKINQPHITVYNPLPWKRSGIVKLQMHAGYIQGNALKDANSGKTIPLNQQNNVFTFHAEDVPSMGYKTYIPVKRGKEVQSTLKINRQSNTIENEFLRVQLDVAGGGIKSILDKGSGRELVKPGSEYGFGKYLYERFSRKQTDAYANTYIKAGWNWALAELGRPGLNNDPYLAIKGSKARVTFREDPLKVKAIMHFDKNEQTPHNYNIIITLYKGKPYIEMHWAIHGKNPEPWPEAGWIPFSLNINNPTFKAGRLGAVVDPATDFIAGSNHDYFFLNTGIAVVDEQGKGVGISSPDVPGISLDRPGLWKYSGKFIPQKPNVFFNLYNNQWSTNFTEWIEGSWNARFYIWSINNYENEKDLVTPSEEFKTPLLAAYSDAANGNLPPQDQGISTSREGIFITAFGSNPEGNGYILRCWEQAGESGNCIVSLPEALNAKYAWPVNLRGEKTNENIEIKNNQFKFKSEAYKPNTFILK